MHRFQRIDVWPRTVIRIVLIVFATLTLGACAGPSSEDFASVAQSGITFTTQVPSVYRYQLNREIDAESEEYAQSRGGVINNASAFALMRQAVADNNDLFIQRRALMDELSQQSLILRKYFVALNALALGAESDAAAAAATSAAKGVEGLVDQAKNRKVGSDPLTIKGVPIAEILSGVTKLAVEQFSNTKLKENLEKYGDSVLGMLTIQIKALEDLDTVNTLEDQKNLLAKVQADYGKPGSLPSDWPTQRRSALLYEPPANPVTSALKAARELEASFRSIAKNEPTSLDELEKSIALTAAIFAILEI